MRIIISPAKTMLINNDDFLHRSMPGFMEETEGLFSYLKSLSYEKLKDLWKCSDKLARLNFERINSMDLYKNLSPAIVAFEGIQYQYMAPGIFENDELDYIDSHLRILSGFYGILKPFDGVIPYRLEMGSKLIDFKFTSLYDYWNSKIAEKIFSETDTIIDLASKEYSRSISKYLRKDRKMIEIVFGEFVDGKIKEKATYAKMARGEMVRFMAENNIENEKDLKLFDRLGYAYADDYSDDKKYIFLK